MNPQDPLSQLRDIHLPQPAGFWPPAPGWWILALTVFVLLAVTVWLIRRQRRKSLWKRLAKAELVNLAHRAERTSQWFSQLNTLLKRAAREKYPQLHPETLSGEAWVEFLLDHPPCDRVAYRPVVEAIVHSAWQPTVTSDPNLALEFAHRWLGGQQC